ncbi:MAG: cytochrome C [Vicinamibacterales bacterium]
MTRYRITGTMLVFASLFLVSVAVKTQGRGNSANSNNDNDSSKIQIGFTIAPVPLNMAGKNPALVGLGSYIVNSQADCAGCHSTPTYAPGGDPHLGQPEQISVSSYLSGGGDLFGPFVPRNLTPNAAGRPANLTLQEFLQVINTGVDLKHRAPFVPSAANDLLQVMPWPLYSKMTDREKVAIYEYLSAIPCLPGTNATRCN